jgi:hypothetical protein
MLEYEVMRVCDAGRKVEKHLRIAGRTRGTISVKQENDPVRNRAILVARLSPARDHRPIPPLYDVTLVSATSETLTLAGYERVEVGPLRFECAVGQSWLLELAVVQDLIDMGNRWNAASGEAHDLREQLARLQSAQIGGGAEG